MILQNLIVIHNDYVAARNLQSTLRKLGYNVPDIVLLPDDVLDRIDDIKPDCVLLDVDIKKPMDSHDLAYHLQSEKNIPVILLSLEPQSAPLHKWGYFCTSVNPIDERELALMIDLILCRTCMRRKIHEQSQLIKLLVENADMGVVRVDSDASVIELNYEASRLTRWTTETARGRSFLDVLKINTNGNGNSREFDLERIFQQGETIDLPQCELITRDGKPQDVSLKGIPLINGKERILSALLLIAPKEE